MKAEHDALGNLLAAIADGNSLSDPAIDHAYNAAHQIWADIDDALSSRTPSAGAIMLEMAKADDDALMWGRRFDALIHIYNERNSPNFRDSGGEWNLADFLAYVGPICGWPTLSTLREGAGQ